MVSDGEVDDHTLDPNNSENDDSNEEEGEIGDDQVDVDDEHSDDEYLDHGQINKPKLKEHLRRKAASEEEENYSENSEWDEEEDEQDEPDEDEESLWDEDEEEVDETEDEEDEEEVDDSEYEEKEEDEDDDSEDTNSTDPGDDEIESDPDVSSEDEEPPARREDLAITPSQGPAVPDLNESPVLKKPKRKSKDKGITGPGEITVIPEVPVIERQKYSVISDKLNYLFSAGLGAGKTFEEYRESMKGVGSQSLKILCFKVWLRQYITSPFFRSVYKHDKSFDKVYANKCINVLPDIIFSKLWYNCAFDKRLEDTVLTPILSKLSTEISEYMST